MPKRSLKTNLKFLKQTQASPLEIKYVSRLLRNKLRNTTGKPTSEIDHNEQIKKNFWGYVKANLKHSSSLSPSFDIETCRTFSRISFVLTILQNLSQFRIGYRLSLRLQFHTIFLHLPINK